MGARYPFTCPGCGYLAEVSGEADFGFNALTVTIICATCKKLRDVVVGIGEPAANVPQAPVCPSARTRSHAIQVWEHPGPCPRCGAIMVRGSAPTILWD